jgi:hypothetical protein
MRSNEPENILYVGTNFLFRPSSSSLLPGLGFRSSYPTPYRALASPLPPAECGGGEGGAGVLRRHGQKQPVPFQALCLYLSNWRGKGK